MSTCQCLERGQRRGCDSGFTEAWAAGTRRPMRARLCLLNIPRLLWPLEDQAILILFSFFVLPFIRIAQCLSIRGNRLQFALDYFSVLGPDGLPRRRVDHRVGHGICSGIIEDRYGLAVERGRILHMPGSAVSLYPIAFDEQMPRAGIDTSWCISSWAAWVQIWTSRY